MPFYAYTLNKPSLNWAKNNQTVNHMKLITKNK